MNKLKGSFGAKLAAWIGLILCSVLFLGSVIGLFVLDEMDVYGTREDVMREDAFKAVSEHYTVIALDNMGNGDTSQFDDTYYRYGIIKAEGLEGLDLNDSSIYQERNFTQKVTEDELYILSYEIGEDTEFYYSGTLFGGYSVYENSQIYEADAVVDAICYDANGGVFYYAAGLTYYPVQKVEIEFLDGTYYQFIYNFEKRVYENQNALYGGEEMAGAELSSDNGTASVSDVETEGYDSLYSVLQREEMTFDMLDHTVLEYGQWNYFTLDGYMRDERDISKIDSMSGRNITEAQDYYYRDDNDTLRIVHEEKKPTETYWVVSILPESVGTGSSNDLFVQANTLIGLAYGLRYGIFPIIAVLFFLSIFLFVFLISAAGHRKGCTEIVETWIDKIPFDLYLVLVGFIEVCMVILVAESISYSMSGVAGIIAGMLVVLVMCILAMLSILSFAVRIKAGTWWSGTVICGIFQLIGRGIRALRESVPVLWKVMLILGGISFIEFLGIITLTFDGRVLLCWLLEKMVLIPLILFGVMQMYKLQEGSRKIAEGDLQYQIDTSRMFWEFKKHGENLNSINSGMSRAVDERMKSERFKTELITNVSHDIKTPLTSIINYVDLLEKEKLENDMAEEYLEVLERQSARLKKLIEDLMEASKASTGNLNVQLEKLEAGVFLVQTIGEFEEKTKGLGLELIIKKPEVPVYIMADGRHFWRVIDNLMNNVCKYAQPSTRVYIDMEANGQCVALIFRNTSKYPLNISSEELMERFVRGDSSRNTEGSGLGLSIAESLMQLMGGNMQLYVDGDLFKVVLTFAEAPEQ